MTEWNGYPENPERDGWHWLRHHDASFCAPVEWRATCGWVHNNIPMLPKEVLSFVVECCDYLGPCLTPAEVAAREQAAYKEGWSDREDDLLAGHQRIGTLDAMLAQARREGMEAAGKEWTAVIRSEYEEGAVRQSIAAAIRAAIEKEREGWVLRA